MMALVAFSAQAGDMKDGGIEHEALKKAIADKSVTLLDVNGTDSYKAGHIPGAIDFIAVKENLADKLPADKGALIVAYCSSEYCGAHKKATMAAKELGYTNVMHYTPGIKGWKAKEAVEKS